MSYNYSNPNFTGSQVYYSPYDIQNLAKYATGVALTEKDPISMGDIASGAVGNMAIQGMSWLKENKGNYRAALQTQAAAARNLSNLYKTSDTFTSGVKAVMNASGSAELLAAMPTAEKLATYSKSTQSLFEQARLAAETLGQTGTAHAAQTANQLLCKANAAAATEAAKNATTWGGKIKNFFGINKASAAINTAASSSSVASKALNTFKSNGGTMMLVMEGATEAVTNVYPTFKQLGAKAGFKQLGKSTVKTVASVGGWVAGAALGTKIGAAIGSIIPGAGTAVGAVVGAAIGSLCSLIGGTLGSKLAKKGAEKIVGKDELEIAKEQQANQLAQAATVDQGVLNQVSNAAAERLNEEGTATKDAQIAFSSLNALQSGTAVTGATQTQGSDKYTTATTTTNPFTTTPSFTSNSALMEQYRSQYGLV